MSSGSVWRAALATALRAVGVKPNQTVLTNAFTLAPVPGAIASINAIPLLVEVTEDLTIDFADLAAKAAQSEVLLLSHMRGHICDMEKLLEDYQPTWYNRNRGLCSYNGCWLE